MVDPNRKINRLTAEDIAFLDECEDLFANRFTNMDDEFRAHCEIPFPPPPVIMNFTGDRGERSGSRQNHSYRGRFNDFYRGGRGGRQRNYNRSHNQHSRRDGGDSGSDGGHRHNYRNYRNNNRESNEDRANDVRREYGKFVAASNSQQHIETKGLTKYI